MNKDNSKQKILWPLTRLLVRISPIQRPNSKFLSLNPAPVQWRRQTSTFKMLSMLQWNLLSVLVLNLSVLISALPNPAFALLNGSEVRSQKNSPYVMISQKVDNEIFDCSGVFVSPNTILTAAHCFEELSKSCEDSTSCQPLHQSAWKIRPSKDMSLEINSTEAGSYTLVRHPHYRTKDYSPKKDNLQTNHDLALIVLKNYSKKQKYTPVSKASVNHGDLLWSYGTGMSRLKLKKQAQTKTVYNVEDDFGTLKRAPFSVNITNDGELLQSQSVMVGHKKKTRQISSLETSAPETELDPTEFQMTPVRGAQILGSDSGGALVKSGKVVGIVRNYELSFTLEELGRVQQGLQKSFTMRGKSIFTSLQSKKNRQFLLSVRQFGGKVFFN